MQLLSSCYLFKGLSESQLHHLEAVIQKIQIQKGQWLMHEGQEATEIFVLKEGSVELLSRIDDGFELPIAILRTPGNCSGTSSLLEPYIYSLSARCFEDSELLIIKKSDLKNLMLADHELSCTIMKNLAQYFFDRLKETRHELKIHFKTLFKSSHR